MNYGQVRSSKQIVLECTNCRTKTALRDLGSNGLCPQCGENILEARYEQPNRDNLAKWLKSLRRRGNSLWRYHEVLPIYDTANIISLGEGSTPLIKSQALAAALGLNHLYIKDERQGPTGSFKDRQATVAISALREMGVDELVLASTGNVAIAYAAYCARAGIKLWAFFPSLTPGDKMRESALYGAQVIKTTGNYDQTKELAAQFAASKGIFLDKGIKSIAAIEAMKTMAYEIAEQLGQELEDGERWRAPDWFLQGVSGGMGPIGVGKGFRELYDFGLIDKVPSMGIIQSDGCAPMVQAFERKQRVATPVENPQTIIATLATGNPGRAYELLYEYVDQNGGHFCSASDQEAFNAIRILARSDGISVEPATGVTFAGLFKMVQQGIIKPDDVVVVNCSGHTLPVEKTILGEQWQRQVELAENAATTPTVPEEGIVEAVSEFEDVTRVVVIEDNQEAARLISRLLSSPADNREVYVANDGAHGLKLVRKARPSLVITDLMMPGVDGFTVIETMRTDPDMRHIPIVVITAKELTVRERQWLEGESVVVLQKGSVIDAEFIDQLVTRLN